MDLKINTYLTGKLGEVFSRKVFPDAVVENRRSHDLRQLDPLGMLVEVKTKRESPLGGWSFLLNRRYWQKRWSYFLFVCLDREYRLKRIYGMSRALVKGRKSIFFAGDNPRKTVRHELDGFRLV